MKLKIRGKILSGFLTIVILALIANGYALYNLKATKTNSESLMQAKYPILIAEKEIREAITGQANDERGFLLNGQQEYVNEIKAKVALVKAAEAKISSLIDNQQEKDLIAQLSNTHDKYTDIQMKVIDLYHAGKIEEAQKLSFNEGRETRKSIKSTYDELEKLVQAEISQIKIDIDKSEEQANTFTTLLAILTIIISLTLSYFISKSIVNPVRNLLEVSEKIADGDLREDVKINSGDEIGELGRTFAKMVANLRNLIEKVNTNSHLVASTSEELATSADETSRATEQIALTVQNVAQGAESQVNNIEQTSNTLNQMSQSIQHIAENASQVSAVAQDASKSADEGNVAIEQAISQMNNITRTVEESASVVKELGERSKEIGQIVDVITGIADQTNLLALNAAIEAARAGEMGRGFAVVAEEVRKLAEQSGVAAQQIAKLIGEIQKETERAVLAMDNGNNEVRSGAQIVNKAGAAFENIQKAVNGVSIQVQSISASVQQVAAGSHSLVDAMEDVAAIAKESSHGTQNVAAASEQQIATMEEIAASADSLSKMADDLQTIINSFKI